ncbi:MAG: hypothetical protein H0U66_00880 [Gemmatimonadaceae bacterium]|nr:hypothetical protein [Gemmatimonadaceae bacterium]
MNPEVDALKQFFAAINRNDMQAIVRDFDPQIVRIEPDGFPTAGTYRGIAEVQENVRTGRGTWAEGSCDPEKFFTKGAKSSSTFTHGFASKTQPNGLVVDLPMALCSATARSLSTAPSGNVCKRSSGPASKTRSGVELHASSISNAASAV